ncbi:hypothetical protein ACQKLX_00075 [Bosea sp. NPDC003192]|jgi:hypothetical protein
MELGPLVRRPRRVSLAAALVALLAVVLGSAAALAAFAPLPGAI